MKIVIFCLVLLPFQGFSQTKAKIVRDTIFYSGRTFTVGDTLQLGYGSGPEKSFVFVTVGGGLLGWNPLASDYAKYSVIINKVQKQKGKVSAKGKLISTIGAINNTIDVDIERALDNKELL